jgi:glycosyltransferase involved in cell wall biosynthesis
VQAVQRGQRAPRDADVSVYHIGNNPEIHGWIVDALRARPGVVVLHDFVLHHLVAGLTLARKDVSGYLRAMERDAGLVGRLLGLGVVDGCVPPLWSTRPEDFPLAGEVLDLAREHALIVHSDHVRERAVAAGFDGPIRRIPMPVWPAPQASPGKVGGEPVIGSFGFLNANKRIPQLLEAFALLRVRHPRARLLLVGPEAPGLHLEERIERLGLGDAVERHDYVDEQRFWSLLAACDVCVSLRWPTMGETSAGVIRMLSLAKPIVVSNVDAFAELPDDVAVKIAPDEREVDALVASLLQLVEDPGLAQGMGVAARAFAEREHDLARVADLYTATLEEAAGGAAVRDELLREVGVAAADVGVGDTSEVSEALREVGFGR